MKNVVLREKTANKIEENEPAKLNKLHKTDYVKEKTNRQTNTVTTESHDSYSCQTFLNVWTRDFKTRMLRVKGERCLVALFKFFVEWRPLNVRWSGPFYFSVKWNRKFYDHLVQTKPVGENTIRNIVTTIRRWYFCLALKKAGIVMVTGHRSVNFLDDHNEADEEERLRLSLTIFKPDEIMKTPALRKSKYW